jgi:hypothetical protein
VQAAQAKLSAPNRGMASVVVKIFMEVTPKVTAQSTVIRHLNAQLTCALLTMVTIMVYAILAITTL